MKLQRVAVLGGGPGGLYAARLLKRSHPDADVTVYEQMHPNNTFGFGVGLASKTQRNLRDADIASFEAIEAASYTHEMMMQVGSQTARVEHRDVLSIGRSTLLGVLQRQAEDAGVHICAGERRDVSNLSADLIVAADGISSSTRSQMASQFNPSITTGAGLYLWCGADFALPTAIFTPVTTEHGTFVAHAYPYSSSRSTFLIETDETTWRKAGFDVSTNALAPEASDEVSLKYLQDAFAESLENQQLIGNRTRWTQFRTVKCKSWRAGNIVLLGDAAHTAHYSIGSGTKLAMEDAIALDRSITAAETLEQALADYEQARRPEVDYLQEIAASSQLWWESFPTRMHLPVEQLMIAYMTRAGKVTVSRFLEAAPEVTRQGLAHYAGTSPDEVPASGIDEWILRQPTVRNGQTYATRVAPAELKRASSTALIDVSEAIARSAEPQSCLTGIATAQTLWLTGPHDRQSVLGRFSAGERFVQSSTATVVIECPRSMSSDAAAGLASSRTHLTFFRD